MADFPLATTQTIIARNAGSLYGVTLGNAAMTSLVAQAGTIPGSLLNTFYLNSVGHAAPALVADALIKNLSITDPAAIGIAKAYIVAALEPVPVNERGVAVNTMLVHFSGLTADPTFGAAATAWNAKIASAEAYAAISNSVDKSFVGGAAPDFYLTTGLDNLTGTAGDDIFIARIIDNQNTLQSGDVIKGGAGNDTLVADIGNSQRFAITAETDSVENILIRAQAVSNDNADNNPSVTNRVQIDAQRMSGVTHWESNNSRADLLIEDVRIPDGFRTKDVTIAMVETDAGNVDFGVYFDQHSLRNLSSGNTTLTINLMDSGAAATAATADKPLLNNPYDQFKFAVNGDDANLFTIQLNTTDDSKLKVGDAETYEQLLQVFQDALEAHPNLTVSLGADFTIIDPISNTAVTGKSIVIVGDQGTIITAPTGSGWYNSTGASVPATSNIYTTYNDVATTITELVTSKIILDDVGRGSTGGDLVVGAMSTGDTSTSRGVERFEIEVRDNSKLQTINSTNNALREVVITNGETSRVHQQNAGAYTDTVLNEGNLTVNGNALGQAEVGNNLPLPGVENNSPAGIHHGVGAAGFTDVRLIDASAFNGKFEFTAAVTTDAINKYINAVDTQGNPFNDIAGAGNVNFNVLGANFIYTGGSDNDIMNVTIDGAVAASRSTVVSGQSDFTFDISGGAGDDNITVRVINGNQPGGAQNWYNNQDLNNNITINGGDGNDTIRTPGAGDVHILAGAGNDTVYTDNTGVQTIVTDATVVPAATADVFAHWIFNTNDQTVTGTASRNINDVRSDVNDVYNLHNGRLTVNFKGIAATSNISSTNFRTSDLEYNQAIKNAINNDAVLSKLLVAKDGPANSLIVESLIDGARVAGDLTVSIAAPAVGTLTVNDITAAGTAFGLVAPTEATVLAAMNAAIVAWGAKGDYASALATDGFVDITGANSFTTSDNIVTPGAGNDVVVLGTTVGADTALSSNETIIYGAAFGNDTIVNFDAAGNGIDHLDFTGLGGTTLTADFTVNRSINVQNFDVTQVNALTLIEANYAANNVAAQQHVFVAVSAHNIASVYSIANPIGAANAVATLEGTIDLADTAWGTLTQANFTNASAANYHLLEGATGAVVVPGPGPGPGGVTVRAAADNTVGAQVLTGADGVVDQFVFNYRSDATGAFGDFGQVTVNNYNRAEGDTIHLVDQNGAWTAIGDFIAGGTIAANAGNSKINFSDDPGLNGIAEQSIVLTGVTQDTVFGATLANVDATFTFA